MFNRILKHNLEVLLFKKFLKFIKKILIFVKSIVLV